MENNIKVGITHGDINGVSYEVILKALGAEGMTDLFTPVIFGVPSVIEKAKTANDLSGLKINLIEDLKKIKPGVINVLQMSDNEPELNPGEVREDAGRSAVEALENAVKALKSGEIDVLVTAPISKEAVQSERFKFPGHTEFLSARLAEDGDAMMILCNDALRVALLTKHIPISKIAENITEEKIVEAVEKFETSLKRDFGIVRPTIAVLSLNPHAGDGGLLGTEEEEIIKPAIHKLVQKGVLVFGPFPADGFFGHSTYKKYDGVMAMYHDQGLAPFKTIAADGGVNFTAGLPFVRTSPDHGTAFDIAWKGLADPKSMRDAIYMAIDIFRRRKNFDAAIANPLKKHVHEKLERPDRPMRHDRLSHIEDSNLEEDD